MTRLPPDLYAVWVPVVLVICGIDRKRYGRAVVGVLLAVSYAIYRIAFVGSGIDYTMPMGGPRGAARYLLNLPYTLCVGSAGTLLVVGVFAAIVWAARKNPSRTIRCTVLISSVFAGVVASMYPIMFAVNNTFSTPGTWYRSPFAPDTCIVILFGTALALVGVRWMHFVGFAMAFTLIAPGTLTTRELWRRNLSLDAAEGKFYLANPDKLLYSQEEASWFIPGVDKLYGVTHEHFISRAHPVPERDRRIAREYRTVWRYSPSGFRSDPALYASIANPSALRPDGTGREAAAPRGSSHSPAPTC